MPYDVITTLAFLAALGSGLVAGVFYAFSIFLMKALRRLAPGAAVAAMQSINIAVINPLFLGVFMGTALLCILLATATFLHWHQPRSLYHLLGCTLYLAGTFLVTMVGNVPLNNALAPVNPAAPDAADHWSRYDARWTSWNHIRTTAALLATAAFILALRQ